MIHKYFQNGYYIVLDVNSGAVHVVDELFYNMLDHVSEDLAEECPEEIIRAFSDRWSEEEIRSTYAEMVSLKKEGQLFSADDYAQFADMMVSSPIKALCLNIAHDCNLRCEYCFAGKGDYCQGRMLMTEEVGKAAIDYLLHYSQGRHNLEVDFFGGEPLMNWDVVKQLVAYARSIEKEAGKNFRFTLTTNGVLVDDEVIEFANKEMHNVVMSIDGRKEVHDRFRVNYAGQGSYDTIIPKFQKFAKARGERDYYVRGTYTHHNTDFTKDILHMADLGFTQLSMEPVVCAPDDPCALTEEDLPVLFEQYEELAKEMIRREKDGKPITFYHYMIDLNHGPCIYKRIAGCGSGTEYLAVTPWGDLYPCHQFVGDEKYLMGNVWDGVTNTEMRDEFKCCNVYARKDCDDCWARLYCSGGCAANAYHATGSIQGTYEYGCKLFRKRMECAIMMQVAKQV